MNERLMIETLYKLEERRTEKANISKTIKKEMKEWYFLLFMYGLYTFIVAIFGSTLNFLTYHFYWSEIGIFCLISILIFLPILIISTLQLAHLKKALPTNNDLDSLMDMLNELKEHTELKINNK